MPAFDIPFYGNLVLCLTLVSAAYTFAMSLGATRGRPRLLAAARYGTFATCALVFLSICLLAYAFQSHDFRIRYVARYSDRSMPWWYLITSLWGGQDGSLLWWLFLLSGYSTAVTLWLRGRYIELQPWILATLMSIFGFFLVLMLFAANPFATFVASAPPDGEGLNPLLQNYWMVIHPPSLYMGFVGWSVPFAFVVAALMTGRLHEEWIQGARLWAMIAWTFLSVGLLLGCLWSYEELGWGGYWAWDPVENASFMPWLVGTAYLHSALVQERYGMLKLWNVFLMCLTFFMTIFGTFLTRSGLIASVHSFAKSDIGIYFVWYMAFLAIGCTILIALRFQRLKGEHRIEALLSREFMFLLNNWVLLGMMIFVLLSTTWPLISDLFRGEEVTVGPGFYNEWMVPLGLMLLFLMGVGPLVSWRKATGRNLGRALIWPCSIAAVVCAIHLFGGEAMGYPPFRDSSEIYATLTGRVLRHFHYVAPLLATTSIALVFATISQEFVRGARVRMKSKKEGAVLALARLVGRARRRYGGYLVHLGIVVMYFGFSGSVYDEEREAALRPGSVMEVGDYRLRYDRPVTLMDPSKRAVYAQLTLLDDEGGEMGTVAPAKFIYRTHPEMPTTEVAIRSRAENDLYVIMSTVDPESQRATFRVIVRPFVAWIWFGGLLLLLGSLIAMWPRAKDLVDRKRKRTPPRAPPRTAAALALLAFMVIPGTADAQSDSSSSLHAGTVVIEDPEERELFGKLLCQCGGCQRLPLDGCVCSWAERARADLSARLAAGSDVPELVASFRAMHGPASIAIPADEGFDRALWAVPVVGLALAALTVVAVGRRWRARGLAPAPERPLETPATGDPAADYDAQLEDELRRMEDG